jgi:WS/DGAT/MGAT family acyltransferase
MLKSAITLYQKESDSGSRLRIPKTRFNVGISPHRVFEGTYFSLDDIQLIRNTIRHNCTVNDVMLCIVSGALRKYLQEHNELPAASLCAMLPQNIRNNDDRTVAGNRVGGIFTDLHTDIENPVERLLAIQKSTSSAKKTAKELNTAALVQNFTGGFLNPCLGKKFNRILQSSRLIERLGPFAANTVITNVPGPDFPFFHAGAQMVSYWGIPPLMDCIGLGHALFSYCGRISLAVTACRDMLPDPQFYIGCCEESFIELMASARLLEPQIKADAAIKSSARISSDGSSSGKTTPEKNQAQTKDRTKHIQAHAD